MDLLHIVKTRYSTKSFNPEKKIPENLWNQIEDTLQFSPSSTNMQPWHFFVATTEGGKKKLMKGTEGVFDFNTQKIKNASHVVLFCSKTSIDETYLQEILEKEEVDGRYEKEGSKESMEGARRMFVDIHKDITGDLNHWIEKQVYLNVGSSLIAAGMLGLDTLVMEGIDVKKINEEFSLTEKGLTASLVVCFGYKTENDFNAMLPKSRLNKEVIFTRI